MTLRISQFSMTGIDLFSLECGRVIEDFPDDSSRIVVILGESMAELGSIGDRRDIALYELHWLKDMECASHLPGVWHD